MEIPQEILDSGVCKVDDETDPELVFSVENYNEKMRIARKFRRKVFLLEKAFLSLNIAMPVIFGMMPAGVIFLINPRLVWLEWTALGVFAAAYLIFGLWRRNFIAVTAFSVLLLLMDARCALMFGVDVVLTVFREKGVRTLKGAEGYPRFSIIKIEAKEAKAPKNNDKPE